MTPSHPAPLRAPRQNFAPFFSLLNSAYITAPPQSELGNGLARLLAVAESYPDLKASANFEALQTQLEGTENRIATARNRYIEHVRDYNSRIRTFPTSLIARLSDLHAKANFEAENEAAATAPQVSFP